MSLGLGDDEECETLQAALAFIDEYGNDLFSDESSSSSRESHTTKHNSNNVTRHSKQTNRISRNTAGTTSLPRPRTKQQLPRRNRSRDRQRLEILQLRAEAQVLQNRIADMKRKQQAADAEDAILDVMNPTFDQDNGLLFGVWKDLAKKYRRLRKESEAENQHLCGVYTHQVATIETLRRLLQTQEQVKRTLRFPKRYCGQSFFYVDGNALVALDRLHGDLGQLYADTDLALLSTGLEAFTSPCSRTNSSPVTDNSTYVDVLLSRIVPFDYKEVADAFWHEITQISVENAAENGHVWSQYFLKKLLCTS
ncbi:hypothetical protein, variant [Phytophthora nicotianae P10297]|uniref:Uncharacterized protein n=1 Tax=Phytophthora nicotianae P10297 TaxID=1317064 RepID=W2YXG9_PHYNI|nr:hypothetical protein, variant [Phytophthora nicotianae P10297]